MILLRVGELGLRCPPSPVSHRLFAQPVDNESQDNLVENVAQFIQLESKATCMCSCPFTHFLSPLIPVAVLIEKESQKPSIPSCPQLGAAAGAGARSMRPELCPLVALTRMCCCPIIYSSLPHSLSPQLRAGSRAAARRRGGAAGAHARAQPKPAPHVGGGVSFAKCVHGKQLTAFL